MAYVNIHGIPGVTVTVTYYSFGTLVPSPTTPLSLAFGVYSLPSAQTEWDRAVFEITSFGLGVLPVTGRITASGAQVAAPYDGVIGIATTNSFSDLVYSQTFAPGSPYSGSSSGTMDLTNRFFIFGHNSGSGPDIQALTGLALELDGTFPTPVFWQDFEGTFEQTTLQKPSAYVVHPAVAPHPAVPEYTICSPDPVEWPPGGPTCPAGQHVVITGPTSYYCSVTGLGDGGGDDDPPSDGGYYPPDNLPNACIIRGDLQCCFNPLDNTVVCRPY